MESKKYCFVIVGLPGSGKSTVAYELAREYNATIASSDFYIERKAEDEGKTYNEVFDKYIGEATRVFNLKLFFAIANQANIVIDRTNLSKKTRRGYLNRFKEAGYYVVCVTVLTDKNIRRKVNESRMEKGRSISDEVVEKMENNFQIPLSSEGFDEMIDYFNFKEV
jgi:tRNA uridine 5-carbamoylmethylation protein Kti12